MQAGSHRGTPEAAAQTEALKAAQAAKAKAEALAQTKAKEAEEADANTRQVLAASKRASLYAILSTRGISVSAPLQEHIDQCADTNRLSQWITQAATALTAEDFLIV